MRVKGSRKTLTRALSRDRATIMAVGPRSFEHMERNTDTLDFVMAGSLTKLDMS